MACERCLGLAGSLAGLSVCAACVGKGEKWRYHVHGDTEVSLGDAPYDKQIESLLEHFRGNLVVG